MTSNNVILELCKELSYIRTSRVGFF